MLANFGIGTLGADLFRPAICNRRRLAAWNPAIVEPSFGLNPLGAERLLLRRNPRCLLGGAAKLRLVPEQEQPGRHHDA